MQLELLFGSVDNNNIWLVVITLLSNEVETPLTKERSGRLHCCVCVCVRAEAMAQDTVPWGAR